MKVTKQLMKNVAVASTIAGIGFLVATGLFYGTSSDFDYFIVSAFFIAVAPVSLLSIVRNRWRQRIERAMPEFLRDIATSLKTGVTISAALEHASKKEYGPLRDELKILVAQMSWGMSLNEALMQLSKRADIPLVKQATVLISEANIYGGDLSEIFDSTARYLEGVNAWNLRRRVQTLPYVGIFYFSVGLFLAIIIMLSSMIFIPTTTLGDGVVPFMKPVLTPTQARRIFLHASLMEALFGGIIAGKISDSSALGGLKHSMMLSVVSGLAFFLFFR